MSVLREVLSHPLNRHRRLAALTVWCVHNAFRRVAPGRVLTVRVGAAELSGPTDHPVINSARYVKRGLFDIASFAALGALLREGDWFLDVGANLGNYSAFASQLIGPNGTIVAIEASSTQASWLEPNLRRLSCRTLLHRSAVADRPRDLDFVQAAGPTIGHLTSGRVSGSVTTVTIDGILAGSGLETGRSAAKFDIEGWEPAALLGASEWLTAGPRGFILEANGMQARSPVAWVDAVSLCRSLGFQFFVADATTRRVEAVDQPPAVSPSHDYIVVRSDLAPAFPDAWRSSLHALVGAGR